MMWKAMTWTYRRFMISYFRKVPGIWTAEMSLLWIATRRGGVDRGVTGQRLFQALYKWVISGFADGVMQMSTPEFDEGGQIYDIDISINLCSAQEKLSPQNFVEALWNAAKSRLPIAALSPQQGAFAVHTSI